MAVETQTELRDAPSTAVEALVAAGFTPLAARVFAARGVDDPNHISPALKNLPNPTSLPGIEEMAKALANVCRSGEKICVVGDYDVDGVTATTIAYSCLLEMGAKASWYIPSRSKHGYGLSPAIVEQQAKNGVKHLLTVDNGVCAYAGIARARELGLTVYVTDHHQPSDGADTLPDYLVNPHVDNGGGNAFDNLVGVGLAFYLMAQLRSVLGCEVDMASYLDLVALGTIADCGEMDATNRALIGVGLARMRVGKTRPGIMALADVCNIKLSAVNTRLVGFRIAPRLNAAGRIANADIAVECLLATEMETAEHCAQQLNILNDMRLEQQEGMLAAARAQISRESAGIVVSNEDWHPGIVGIVAGKLADQFKRPSFVFYLENGTHWRGSGRAAAGVDLIRILNTLYEQHSDVLLNFGGHRQAASIAVHLDYLPKFATLFDDICREVCSTLPPPTVQVDATSAADITFKALSQLEHVVWGNGFSPPLYSGSFSVLRQEPLRGGHVKLYLRDNESGNAFAAAHFGVSELEVKDFTALYSAEISPYTRKPQLVVEKILSPKPNGTANGSGE